MPFSSWLRNLSFRATRLRVGRLRQAPRRRLSLESLGNRYVQLELESLEDRMLLSGNVTANVLQGTLTVQGDTGDNAIQITPGLAPGTVDVSGIAGYGGSPTSVNGSGVATFTVDSFTNINIQMKDGNDTVMVNVNIPNNLTINAGKGNDTFTVASPFGSSGPLTATSLTIKAASTKRFFGSRMLTMRGYGPALVFS